jgi:hypothetical protein
MALLLWSPPPLVCPPFSLPSATDSPPRLVGSSLLQTHELATACRCGPGTNDVGESFYPA